MVEVRWFVMQLVLVATVKDYMNWALRDAENDQRFYRALMAGRFFLTGGFTCDA